MQTTENTEHTLLILTVLREAAQTKADPKPRLRARGDTQAHLLADLIEQHYSQAKALAASKLGLTPTQLHILAVAEANDQLLEGYSVLIDQIKQELENTHRTAEEAERRRNHIQDIIREFKNRIECDELLAALKEANTPEALKKLGTNILEAIQKDGKTLTEAFKASEAYRCFTEEFIPEATAATNDFKAQIHKGFEACKKNGKTGGLVAAAAAAGVLIGAALSKKR